MQNSIAKYIVGATLVGAFTAYVIFSSNQNDTVTTALSPTTSSGTATLSSSSTTQATEGTAAGGTPPTSPTSSNTGESTSTKTSSGIYKDGTYTGKIADAFYGNLQVAAVIQGGKLTDVQFPVYPSENNNTKKISETDLPLLKQEAIAAQSANVNVVSGATQVSQAFEESLASALAQAKQ